MGREGSRKSYSEPSALAPLRLAVASLVDVDHRGRDWLRRGRVRLSLLKLAFDELGHSQSLAESLNEVPEPEHGASQHGNCANRPPGVLTLLRVIPVHQRSLS